MKMILIYATRPRLLPLALVNDVSDAIEWINGRKVQAQARHDAKLKAVEELGGTVTTLSVNRYAHAKWTEVDVSF
jgi:hypothetical protein